MMMFPSIFVAVAWPHRTVVLASHKMLGRSIEFLDVLLLAVLSLAFHDSGNLLGTLTIACVHQ